MAAAAAASLLPPRLRRPHVSYSKSISLPLHFPRCPKSGSTPARALPSSPSDPSPAWDREEERWLREEKRWLREEHRWLREESRWNSEREALLHQIAALKLRIEALKRATSAAAIPNANASLEVLLPALKDRVAAGDGGRKAPPVLAEEADVKEMILEEIKVAGIDVQQEKPQFKEGNRKTLRKGAEGEDVRLMQEALQKLGFYSGEEDMEFSTFSSGTERAVKTWQASSGTNEDGIMTSQLLEKLFMEMEVGKTINRSGDEKTNFIPLAGKDGANGSAVTFIETHETVINDDGIRGVEVSEHKVFLLGENRWEEPSRLAKKGNLIEKKVVSTTKCLSCHGEGRLMCTECDGTGEPNIEPQFLEWIGEGAKCPYCEGLGYTICDVCEGKTAI